MIALTTLLPLLAMQAPSQAEATPGFRLAAAANAAGGWFRQYGAIDGRALVFDLSLDWYLRRPVVDDGKPLATAPYRQRLDWLSVGGSGTWLEAKDGLLGGEHTGSSVEAWLATLWYRRWAVFGAKLEYAHADGHELSAETGAVTAAEVVGIQRVRPSVTFGIRDGDFELRGTYSWSSYFDAGRARAWTWGQVSAFARLLVEDGGDFTVQAYTLGHGAGVSVGYQHFTSPRTRLWLRGTYENGAIYNQTDVWHQWSYERPRFSTIVGEGRFDDSGYLAELGVGFWPSRRCELRFWASGGAVSFPGQPAEGDVAYGGATVIKQFLLHVGWTMRGRPSY